MSRKTWAILTGEYPPAVGGVSHYTHQVARGLAAAGDDVHVWTPAVADPPPADAGVTTHRLLGAYSPRGLVQLQRELSELRRPYRLLLQYTPIAFGMYGANYIFAHWLAAQRASPWVMFHELHMPLTRSHPMKYNVLAIAQRLMLAMVMNSAKRVFVSIPAWGEQLEGYRNGQPVDWLPIPSTIAGTVEPGRRTAARAKYLSDSNQILLGHFGTYGKSITNLLDDVAPSLLRNEQRRVLLLMGRGSAEHAKRLLSLHADLEGRIRSTGSLASGDLSAHLAACDLLVQPYPDGVSTRRSSLVAGMALGVPTVASVGALSEPFWLEKQPILLAHQSTSEAIIATAESALARPEALSEWGRRAKDFYNEHLDLHRTIDALRSAVDCEA